MTEFRRFVNAQLETIARDIGPECRGDRDLENVKVMEWVEKNAARFRAEWMAAHGVSQQEWSRRCDGAS